MGNKITPVPAMVRIPFLFDGTKTFFFALQALFTRNISIANLIPYFE